MQSMRHAQGDFRHDNEGMEPKCTRTNPNRLFAARTVTGASRWYGTSTLRNAMMPIKNRTNAREILRGLSCAPLQPPHITHQDSGQ